ncbi:DUF1345 domain-containing protein [Rhizobium sp. RU36D]|uniref:DUF1345 domain-containing protein n=1 Tax=Rhizobium sp. RU36D TaxID=1907415 RepID=UPI0009D7FEB9|nr:DUF1345 domain-containing protein [Rhizobium sp. RU36D]SMC82817.1 Uncharacterized membrane protein [Rhizobium sp. RU36D]
MKESFNSLIGHRHGPFLAAILVSLATAAGTAFWRADLVFEAAAVAFFCIYLILMACRIPQLTTVYLRQNAETADEPAAVIIAVAALAVVVCFVSLFSALNGGGETKTVELILLFASVISGWMTIHTMAAIHYAHLYWRPDVTMRTVRAPHGGLEFPGGRQACGMDFLYFAFVIGMTAQTSDVQITSTPMRQLNLLHAVGSFFFNTVLVAAVVNAAVTLAG